MRKTDRLLLLFLVFFTFTAKAQLKTGSEGVHIKSGTKFSVDELIMEPNVDVEIKNTTITRELIPVFWPQFSGIKRVYHFSSPIAYKGLMGFNFQNAELNGNVATDLVMAYTNTGASTNFIDYLLSKTSVVNTSNNYIRQTFDATANLSNITAVTPGFLVTPVTPASATICEGSSVTLSTVPAVFWQWYKDGSPVQGATRSTLVVVESGSYTVRAGFTNGIISTSDPVVVSVNGAMGGNLVSEKGNEISLGATTALKASGGTSYFWEDADGIISGHNTDSLIVRPTKKTTYKVVISSGTGCNIVRTIDINVLDDYKTLQPNNMITPNGDGVNDVWVVKNIDVYPNNELKIVDRAGRLVYSQNGYNNTWDGTLNGVRLPEDTYYYVLNIDSGKGKLTGFISIVRE